MLIAFRGDLADFPYLLIELLTCILILVTPVFLYVNNNFASMDGLSFFLSQLDYVFKKLYFFNLGFEYERPGVGRVGRYSQRREADVII